MLSSDKYIRLIQYLEKLERVVIAFSGGVDSTFLLKAASEALGDHVKAVTIQSPYIPKWEVDEAKQWTKELGIDHEVVEMPIIDEIKKNPEDRCYLCKKAIFKKIQSIAEKEGYNFVIEGTNFDDTKDYRPGLRALKELQITSPLLACELTKQEIRDLSKELELTTWNKPSYACLLTRIPYGNKLDIRELEKIEEAEKYMMQIGFKAVRVRCHKDLARIEVNRNDRKKLFDENMLDTIANRLREIGFKYITLDLEGYRVGSFNETISK